ncbi:hypothetical protein Anas_10015 [Armadillidium nasatum]|uniref:Uncharacterized protein n=1 Tax=Armadillidium nasatum TaxID=96803 RepID=A0A5N5T869_9CRUS|nr:hypothetical protein Anas_10015 [Armadillidium nasatum]
MDLFYKTKELSEGATVLQNQFPLAISEIKFKKRNIQEIESAKKSKKTGYLESKPSCSYQLYPETDQESTISESASEENIHQSYVEMLATSSNNGSDPDYIADGLSDQQNRRELRTLAEACDRYQISDRAGAAIASSVLVDFGLITRDKMQNATSILTIFHQRAEKELISPMESIRKFVVRNWKIDYLW